MQSVPTKFLRSLVGLQRLPDTYTSISECTLIHDARNTFASKAITGGFDRVLWLDSDMTFDADLMLRLSTHLDDGKHIACGLYLKRQFPTEPVIYCRQDRLTDPVHGEYIQPVPYLRYPRDKTFRVAACGFGAVMTSVEILRAVWDKYGPPFSYYMNIGEDMSFCYRVEQMGQRIWCDSTIKCGHVGPAIYDEDCYAYPDEPGKAEADGASGHGHPERA